MQIDRGPQYDLNILGFGFLCDGDAQRLDQCRIPGRAHANAHWKGGGAFSAIAPNPVWTIADL